MRKTDREHIKKSQREFYCAQYAFPFFFCVLTDTYVFEGCIVGLWIDSISICQTFIHMFFWNIFACVHLVYKFI